MRRPPKNGGFLMQSTTGTSGRSLLEAVLTCVAVAALGVGRLGAAVAGVRAA
jgi:hypothetical protein